MLREKKKILIIRIVFSILFLLGVALAIFASLYLGVSKIVNDLIIIATVVSFMMVLATIKMKVKIIEYKGQDYVVYAGIFKAYLRIKDEIVAVNDSYHKHQPMQLIYKLDEEKTLYVTIKWSNAITAQIIDNDYKIINGQMYFKSQD